MPLTCGCGSVRIEEVHEARKRYVCVLRRTQVDYISLKSELELLEEGILCLLNGHEFPYVLTKTTAEEDEILATAVEETDEGYKIGALPIRTTTPERLMSDELQKERLKLLSALNSVLELRSAKAFVAKPSSVFSRFRRPTQYKRIIPFKWDFIQLNKGSSPVEMSHRNLVRRRNNNLPVFKEVRRLRDGFKFHDVVKYVPQNDKLKFEILILITESLTMQTNLTEALFGAIDVDKALADKKSTHPSPKCMDTLESDDPITSWLIRTIVAEKKMNSGSNDILITSSKSLFNFLDAYCKVHVYTNASLLDANEEADVNYVCRSTEGSLHQILSIIFEDMYDQHRSIICKDKEIQGFNLFALFPLSYARSMKWHERRTKATPVIKPSAPPLQDEKILASWWANFYLHKIGH